MIVIIKRSRLELSQRKSSQSLRILLKIEKKSCVVVVLCELHCQLF